MNPSNKLPTVYYSTHLSDKSYRHDQEHNHEEDYEREQRRMEWNLSMQGEMDRQLNEQDEE